ncbi:hypothetical protein P3X46_024996 [Hevea brasiliensis]|uniref:TTF-type domain-containing protein n=1 Tax=Hevea brasiliensis TaxID=3981 RepID=A0ABQ9L468_HEVBR|nr:hypothetical protein P3X46_024996 [Hevea brasiliensis]
MSKYSYDKNHHRFQALWFKFFLEWLEYSPTKDAAFCLLYYLFNKPSGHFVHGKNVNDAENYAFLCHVGKDPNSLYKVVVKKSRDLMNHNEHIKKVIEKQSCQQIENNFLRLKVSCGAIKWLIFQACALRRHDESSSSKNRVQDAICDEIGDGKFHVIVDDARDESKKEQMAIMLRFVNKHDYVRKPFFDLVHVLDTTALTLKKEILDVFSLHNLSIKNIRGNYSSSIFFSKLTLITNVVTSSSKRHDQLQVVQIAKVEKLITNDELKTSEGLNQVGTIKRFGDTRWSSHLSSVRILVTMFEATYLSQDILNAMHLVSITKMLIRKMRESGWDSLLESVKLFCEKYEIDIPNMNAHYNSVDVFITTIDSQLQELNVRFKEDIVELLTLSFSFDPRDDFKSFRIDDVCSLANKFYSEDFSKQEKLHLKYQLEHFECDIQHDLEMQKLSTISKLCQYLIKSRKSTIYPLIDRLVKLVLTLLVSTATTERAFSTMSLVKTKLHNKMGVIFLQIP